jgi:hypothetical protein
MKQTLSAFLIIFSVAFWASDKTQLTKMYEIISDTVDANVPAGKCLITGVITYNEESINEANIFSESAKLVNSDKLGRFRILVDTADTYLVIEKKNIPSAYVEYYKFQSQHHIDLKVFIPEPSSIIMVDKPVIYAYGNEGQIFDLNVQPKGKFTFTYPEIGKNNNWSASINSGGISVGNKIFPYLFYESQMADLNFISDKQNLAGSVIGKQEVVHFLEQTLTALNFNIQEQTDFITYWAPKMITHERVFIQFWIDGDYEAISALKISPQPDNLGRVFMVYSPLDKDQEIKCEPQQFESFARDGFTIIEWGGSELPKQKLYTTKTL